MEKNLSLLPRQPGNLLIFRFKNVQESFVLRSQKHADSRGTGHTAKSLRQSFFFFFFDIALGPVELESNQPHHPQRPLVSRCAKHRVAKWQE